MRRREREWMYQRLDNNKKMRREFAIGVHEFLACAKEKDTQFNSSRKIRCPCPKCKNMKYLFVPEVKYHVARWGFTPNYYDWICHGEEYPEEQGESSEVDYPYRDTAVDTLHDNVEGLREEPPLCNDESSNPQALEFYKMFEESEKPLYEGSKLSLMEVALRVMKLKHEFNLTPKCVDEFASLIDDIIPKNNGMVNRSLYSTKELLRGLQLSSEKNHACSSREIFNTRAKYVNDTYKGKRTHLQEEGAEINANEPCFANQSSSGASMTNTYAPGILTKVLTDNEKLLSYNEKLLSDNEKLFLGLKRQEEKLTAQDVILKRLTDMLAKDPNCTTNFFSNFEGGNEEDGSGSTPCP